MIKAALSDLDDTLIPFGAARASQRAIEAIHHMLDSGLHFEPVTGRIPAAMTWMFDGDERCYATGAFANGRIVCIDGTVVKTVSLPNEALRCTQVLLDDLSRDVWLCCYSIEDPRDVTLVTAHPDRVLRNPPETRQRSVFSIEHELRDRSRHIRCPLGQCP